MFRIAQAGSRCVVASTRRNISQGAQGQGAADARNSHSEKMKAERPRTENWIFMRSMSGLEVDSIHSWADLRKLREEKEILRQVLKDLGFGVVVLPADEKSPFSSRISRYARQGAHYLFNFYHPDGHSESAHKALTKAIKERDIIIPFMQMRDRYNPVTYDPRDMLMVGNFWMLGYRDSVDSEKAIGILADIVKVRGKGPERRDEQQFAKAVRGLNLQERGITRSLSNVATTPDGQYVIFDPTVDGLEKMLYQTSLTHRGYKCLAAPPYATEAHFIEMNVTAKNPLLMPIGFSEASAWLKDHFRSVDLVPCAFTEHLKMGIPLREILLHVRAARMEAQGAYYEMNQRRYQHGTGSQHDHDRYTKYENTKYVTEECPWTRNPYDIAHDHLIHKASERNMERLQRMLKSSNRMIRDDAMFTTSGIRFDEPIEAGPKADTFGDWKSSMRRTSHVKKQGGAL